MADPRWLDDREQRTWRSFVELSALLFERLDAQLLRDAGMPHTYYVILAMLSEAPSRTMRMNELARATMSSPSRLSHAVRRLEEQGLVRRVPCDDDGRGTLAVLTAAGMRAVRRAAPGHVAEVRRNVFDHLTRAEQDQLGRLLGRLRDSIAEGTGT